MEAEEAENARGGLAYLLGHVGQRQVVEDEEDFVLHGFRGNGDLLLPLTRQ